MNVDIDKLEELAKAAGGEEWTNSDIDGVVFGSDGDSVCVCHIGLGLMPEAIYPEHRADFIAAANPATLLALISELRQAREAKAVGAVRELSIDQSEAIWWALQRPESAKGLSGPALSAVLRNQFANAALASSPALPEQGWKPIKTAPDVGFLMVYEDGAMRLRLRINGEWHDTAYPAIKMEPWGDIVVGADAQRLVGKGNTLIVRDGCCENPTHWCELPTPPAAKEQEKQNG